LRAEARAQASAEDRENLADTLESLNQKLAAISKGKGRTADIFDVDRDFHRAIVHAGAGPRLATLHGAVEPQAERYWRLYASSIITDLHMSVREHAAIIAAVRRGDADGVEAALQNNWIKGADRLGHVIDIFGERGSW